MVREPRFHPIAIDDLRPTQMTDGMREVTAKRAKWKHSAEGKQADFLGSHLVPVVIGPKDKPFLIDHHHLARALLEEGVKQVAITVVADLARLEKDAFWVYLDNRSWMHPFDAAGARRAYGDLPKKVADLKDDPYRSLAGELRRAGGYAKDTTPFSEFLWADALRRRVKRAVVDEDFSRGLEQALRFAKSADADYLPGWCGASPDD